MKRKTFILGAALLPVLLPMPELTWAKDRIAQRLQIQSERISRGVSTGAITPLERKPLNREQNRIRRYANRAWRDGELRRYEKRKFHVLLNRAGRSIYWAKHNQRVFPTHRAFDRHRAFSKHGVFHRFHFKPGLGSHRFSGYKVFFSLRGHGWRHHRHWR
jgi:hypothetical protein